MGSAQVRTEGVLRELIFFFLFSVKLLLFQTTQKPKTQVLSNLDKAFFKKKKIV